MVLYPIVSIIIPVYNGTNFMREAIECALNQTYKKTEIIVVNDGSTDNGETERTVLSYGDRIRYIAKENGGVSSALNRAIEASEGDYFSWLSHDDLYTLDKIEKEIVFLNNIIENDNHADLNKTVIHCATISIDKYGNTIKVPSYRGVDENEDNLKVIIDNVYNYRLSGCSFLIPKAAYSDVGGFREDIRTVSDVEYWYRLLFNGYKFYCLKNERLVKNRSHGRQVGKLKIELFEKELNDLHIEIADKLLSNTQYNDPRTIERYYLGLIKRGMKEAAVYTKKNGLDGRISQGRSNIILPIKAGAWSVRGHAKDTARKIYRRIFVK